MKNYVGKQFSQYLKDTNESLKYYNIPYGIDEQELSNSIIIDFKDIVEEMGGPDFWRYFLLHIKKDENLNKDLYAILVDYDDEDVMKNETIRLCVGVDYAKQIFNEWVKDALDSYDEDEEEAIYKDEESEDLWETNNPKLLIDTYKDMYVENRDDTHSKNIQEKITGALQSLIDNNVKLCKFNSAIVNIIVNIFENDKGDAPSLDNLSSIEVDWPEFIEEWDYFLDVGEFYSFIYKDGKKVWVLEDFEKGTYIISPERVDEIINELQECFKEDMNIQLIKDVKKLKKDFLKYINNY